LEIFGFGKFGNFWKIWQFLEKNWEFLGIFGNFGNFWKLWEFLENFRKFWKISDFLEITFTTNRYDGTGERFQNVGIHVGDEPAVIGGLVTNPECAIFVGPSATGNIEQITCTQPLTGLYLQIQLRDPNPQYLQINEIVTR
jgi:hypothetical protein